MNSEVLVDRFTVSSADQAVEYDLSGYTPEELASVAGEMDLSIVVNNLAEAEQALPQEEFSASLHRKCVELTLEDSDSTESRLLHKLNIHDVDEYYAYFDTLVSGRGEGVTTKDLLDMRKQTEEALERAAQKTTALVEFEVHHLLKQAKKDSAAGRPNVKVLGRATYLIAAASLPKTFLAEAIALAA